MSSCVKCDTIASNEDWKEAGGKTKRGRPTGRREVTEKYKANQGDDLDDLCKNRKELRIENRVRGYGFNRYAPFIPPMLAKERRRTNKLALQDQLLSVEDEASPEQVEDEARAEAKEMMTEIDSQEAHNVDDPLWRLLSYTAPGKDTPFPFVLVLLYDADLN